MEVLASPSSSGDVNQCNSGSVASGLDGGMRPRTNSFEKRCNGGSGFRRRAESQGSQFAVDTNLRKKTLVGSFHKSMSRDESSP